MKLLPLLLLACAGSPEDSAGGDADADTDTDADTDADTDVDDTGTYTDTDPSDATVTGGVVLYDGTAPPGMDVQLCETVCFSGVTLDGGGILFEELDEGSYKLDVLGEAFGSGDYGHSRVHVELAMSEQHVLPAPVFVPQVVGPETIASSGTYEIGAVTWTVDPAQIELPFGADEGQFWVGVVAGEDIPAGMYPVTASLAVAFLPFGAEPLAAFDLTVDAALPAGTYDLYDVDDHGNLEAAGTATSDGAVVTATEIAPRFLTWLLFVPQG
ncbi:MAG: hypothetical protein ACOZNI_15215 [Myxococcota bacterium]